MDALNKLKGQVKALKEEVSELGRQHELRGRELTAARKKAAKVDEMQAERDNAAHNCAVLSKQLVEAEAEVENLRAKLAKHNGILDDVAALKRLVA